MIELEHAHGVAVVRMHEHRCGALTPSTLDRVVAALRYVGDSYAVVLTGWDDVFSRGWAGGDAELLERAVLAVAHHPTPVVAAIAGDALGAGYALAAAADARVMSAGRLGLAATDGRVLSEGQLGVAAAAEAGVLSAGQLGVAATDGRVLSEGQLGVAAAADARALSEGQLRPATALLTPEVEAVLRWQAGAAWRAISVGEKTFDAEAALLAGLVEATCAPGEVVRAAVERAALLAGPTRQFC